MSHPILQRLRPILASLALLAVFQAASAQSREVTGSVLDETDAPVAGAFVTVKGETRGVMTDGAGKFSLKVKDTDRLIVSFLGYEDEEVPVGSQKQILVKLVPQANQLDEVVMVAYGTQRKASVIGSISSVSTDQLRTPVGQLSSSLAGKLAGIVAVQQTGEPGAGADFWIRGMNTFGANSKPLVLVDGIERDMDLVDADDIASFSILKDATATALYGVRGANGIVLITTKRGSESKPKISFKAETGIITPTRLPELASPSQWIDYYNGLYTERGATAPINAFQRELYLSGVDQDLYPAVDWMDTIFKDHAASSRLNMSVTGGTKNVRYYVGGSYYYEDGIFNAQQDRYDAGMDFNKFSFRSNVDINVTKNTILGLSLSNQFTDTNSPASDRNTLYAQALAASPVGIVPVYSDGTLTVPEQGYNPYNSLNSTGYRTIKNNVAQATLTLTHDFSDSITEGLSANIKFSWDAQNQTVVYRNISPAYFRATGRDEEGNLVFTSISGGSNYMTMSRANTGWNTMNLEAGLNYERSFGGHRVSGMFLYNMRTKTNNVPDSYLAAFDYKNLGVAGRATWSWKDRYFAEFNFGYNGSENFAKHHRFGFFPSYALGYMVSNEPFWADIRPVVDQLKFKASYGHIGSDQISTDMSRRYAYNTTMNTSAAGAVFGKETPSSKSGISTGVDGNDSVSWEQATKANAGLELSLFQELRYVLDFFYDRRDGIFIQRQSQPSAVGIQENQFVNIGKMRNAGFDMTLEYDHTFGNGLYVSARGNYSFNRNKIIYNDLPDQVWKYQNTAGFVYTQQRGLIAEGLFRDQDEIEAWPDQSSLGSVRPGDIKYRDINGDGVIDDYDKVAIGYTTIPEINYGFGVSVGWKGWDASVFFSGVAHVTRIISGNNLFGATADIKYEGQIFADVAEHRWTVDNPDADAKYPRLSLENVTNNQVASTFWQKDMSHLRLKNAELGYTLPKRWTSRIGLSTTRVYLQGTNLLTFSKFKLWDPELATANGSAYPNTKTYCIGLNLNF